MRDYKQFICVAGLVIFLSLLLTLGCGKKKSTSPQETDQDVIFSLITSSPDIFGSCVIDTVSDTTQFGKVKVVAGDTVKFWWRVIFWGQTRRSIDIDVSPSDGEHPYPYANVTITDTLTGNLHLIRKAGAGDWSWSTKPITDVARRSAYFERRRPVDSPRRGWDLIGVSGLLVQSVPTTREIEWVRIASTKSGYDTTITENYIIQCTLLEDLITLDEEDSVTLTVYTGDPTDSVYLHAYSRFFPHLFHVRRSFVNNGDGSFSGTWVTAKLALGANPYRHAAIDVIKHGTLDGEDPYDSRIWGVIYRIEPL